MIIENSAWQNGQAEAYKYTDIVNLLGKSTPGYRWDVAGGVTAPVQPGGDTVFPTMYVNTNYVTLAAAVHLFRYARLLKCRVKIEWLGRLIENQAWTHQGTEAKEMEHKYLTVEGFGTTLMAKFCHERYNRNRADGNVEEGLAPAYMFGWDTIPILDEPDMISTIDARGTCPSGNLASQPGIKHFRFTPERRTGYMTYKPLNRLDRAGATFDLAKITAQGAVWDGDMRSGTLWLGQQNTLARVIEIDQAAPRGPYIYAPHDYFRVTYVNTWKFYGAARQGQDNPGV